SDRTGGPLTNTVNREYGCFIERRRIESTRRMALVMIAEQQFPFELAATFFGALFSIDLRQLGANQIGHPEFFTHPKRHRLEKRSETGRRVIEVSLEKAIEFQEWLVVETNEVEFLGSEVCFRKTVTRGVERKAMIVLDAREAFLLCGS